MTKELVHLGKVLLAKKLRMAEEIHNKRMNGVKLTHDEKEAFKQIEPQILRIRADFISIFAEALIKHTDLEHSHEKINEWGEDNGRYLFTLGIPLDEALKDTGYYREHIWQVIKEESVELKLDATTVFDVISIIDPLLDKAVYCFSLTYVKFFQKSLESAKTSFLELSVPVVPLVPGVGVLPLIGNMDTERANLLMEETLKQSVNLELTHLVLDISGVLIVDTMVADQLFKVIDALSLIGVQTIITGIRPEVAQTIVSLGLDLSHITVKANLHAAFKEIQLIKNME